MPNALREKKKFKKKRKKLEDFWSLSVAPTTSANAPLDQCRLNATEHSRHLGHLVTLRTWVPLGWAGAQVSAFLTSFQMALMRQVHGPHSEEQGPGFLHLGTGYRLGPDPASSGKCPLRWRVLSSMPGPHLRDVSSTPPSKLSLFTDKCP